MPSCVFSSSYTLTPTSCLLYFWFSLHCTPFVSELYTALDLWITHWACARQSHTFPLTPFGR
eukprot:m.6419 g.6419  ORF g.6419 m.6419 type:complete len:62 (+) comp8472_c0_seq1:123-308(+)